MNQKAQNVVEYILLTIVVVIVFVYLFSPAGPFKKSLQHGLDTQTQHLKNMTDDIKLK